ncbi:GNAT family N-acetyltransferase [Pseudactinotalea sp. Z1739]|uniref:GNAT family N-acetyltransferase n=1 Tax=Pseudactinotalea sp. Z1739 TaxID=3413028 RepID=UPI003C7ACBEC
MRARIRAYRDDDEASWLRCRALSFHGSAYFDDVKAERTTFENESIQLVATGPRPAHVRTPGSEQVVGILDLELWDDEGVPAATIDTIGVHPDHQRQGIADALLSEALARLAAAGTTVLDAWTREDGAANAWYVRHGFRVAQEYLHVHAGAGETHDFTSPAGLSRPVKAFCHARLADEQAMRARYARVHRCRRYTRPVRIPTWTQDPALVATYDAECAGRRDHDFYLALARRLPAERVTDLGCGTGVLAVDLAAAGHQVTGVDPAGAILEIARTRPGGEQVRWIHGTSAGMPDDDADLVVMEGHVAQYFLGGTEWARVLDDIHRTLRPGGHVAFESRNPAARCWETWTRKTTEDTYPHPDGGQFRSWSHSIAVAESAGYGAVETHEGHTVLPDGRHLVNQETLRFRTLAGLTDSLTTAGFTVTATWGDFSGADLTEHSPEFILLARRD